MPQDSLLGRATDPSTAQVSRFTPEGAAAAAASNAPPTPNVSFDAYSAGDWPAVRDFLARHWRSDHPLLDRELFTWQYRGFGPRVGTGDVKLIRVGGELAGFLGLIPGIYFRDGDSTDGAAIALWVVRPDLRDRGLGVLALREARAEHGALVCVGINETALPIYHKLGFSHTRALRRWAAILNPAAAAPLLGEAPDLPKFAGNDATLPPCDKWDLDRLALVYARTVMTQFRAGLSRTVGYWRWRYQAATGYSYRLFDHAAGLVVARVERVIAPDRPAADRLGVLRLIEILPASVGAWDGAVEAPCVQLIRGVLAWGAAQGCVLADFQHSSTRLDPLLRAAGLTPIDNAIAWTSGVPNLFQPLRPSVGPLNAAWTIKGATPIGADDIYLVKSDGDMDRPNVWPMPLEYVD